MVSAADQGTFARRPPKEASGSPQTRDDRARGDVATTDPLGFAHPRFQGFSRRVLTGADGSAQGTYVGETSAATRACALLARHRFDCSAHFKPFEKQGFLKALYEDFYKAHNKKAADRLGVVYTPGEIVRFMIRSADWLCERRFGESLIDPGVEILDPATCTGTFIVELLEHFRGHRDKSPCRH